MVRDRYIIDHASSLLIVGSILGSSTLVKQKKKRIKVNMASRVRYVDNENYILTTRDLFIFRPF